MSASVVDQLKNRVPPARTEAQRKARRAAQPAAAEPKPARTSEPGSVTFRLPERAQPVRRRKTSFELPVDLARDFRIVCTTKEILMREVVAALIEGFVDEHRELLPPR